MCVYTCMVFSSIELITQLLADGRGACFTIEPAECPLLAFESRKIIITAYSDMWGQYTDQLICKVCDYIHVCTVQYTTSL